MSSKKEEERNEKIIRGLMKLPPNRRCINCNSLGPQYVCTNFWTFVCTTCSGIHREFTHRVKSVSMAKFTTQEVEALQRGGNQRAREQFLNDWDTQRMRLPDNSNPSKIREFIKNVYVDKKYVGGRSSDKPPRDTQTLKGGEDHRRASSYHSFSQSPPYDHQYEERRYGRQAGMLTRKPGSDRGHYEGKLSSFIYSPGHQVEQMYEDRFANESSGSRMSDYSVSSVGDPFRFEAQSPNFQGSGYSSPPLHAGDKDMRPQKLSSSESNVKENPTRIPRAHRSASSGSFGSFDGNSISLKSANSGSLFDSVLEPEQASGIQQAETSIIDSSQLSLATHVTNSDLLAQAVSQPQSTSLVPTIDLFANTSHPSAVPPLEQKLAAVPPSGNEGWATFDLPHHMKPSEANQEVPPMAPVGKIVPKEDIDLFSLMPNNSDWSSVQNPASHGLSCLMDDLWSFDGKESSDSRSLQLWDAFDDLTGKPPQNLPAILSQNSEPQVIPCRPPAAVDSYIGFKAPEAPEVNFTDVFLSPAIDDKIPPAATLHGTHGSDFPLSAVPQMGSVSQERKAANPFDLPFDSDTEANNVFMDMSSLQAALPDQQSPSTFLGGLSDTWFSQNTLASFIPSIPQGGLPYIGGQVPTAQMQNIPSQGPVASLGGNPFA